MKTVLVACIVCLLLGLGIGWFSGQRHERKKTENELEKLKTSLVNFYASDGSNTLQAIKLIESGDKQGAVELLAQPIARSYEWYYRRKDNPSKELVGQIERLAEKYPVVSNSVNRAKEKVTGPRLL